MKALFFVPVLLTCCLITAQAAQSDQSADSRAEPLLKNWKSAPPDFLNDPAHRDVVALIRKAAEKGADDRARLLLLKVEDPATVRMCLDEMRRENAYRQAAAAQVLGASGQPGLIRFLAEDLNINEPTRSKRIPAGEEVVRVTPTSVLATQAILEIVGQAQVFNHSMKAWATSLGPKSEDPAYRERTRDSVRLWWKQNEAAIKAGDYSRVQPPRQ